MRANNLPWIGHTQPVVWLFLLPAVLNHLLEDAVFVAQTVTSCWQLQGCHGIEEACREPPEPTVPESSVGLLLLHGEEINLLLHSYSLHYRAEQEIANIVGQRAAQEKLH